MLKCSRPVVECKNKNKKNIKKDEKWEIQIEGNNIGILNNN